MKTRKPSFLIIYVVILLLLFSWMLGIFGEDSNGLTYSQVVNLFRQEQVRSFTVEEDTIYLQMHGSDEIITGTVADAESFRREMWETIGKQQVAETTYNVIIRWFDSLFLIPLLIGLTKWELTVTDLT